MPCPLRRGLYGMLVDNFRHESDITSLQDPFRHVPTRPLAILSIVFPIKSEEEFSFKSMSNIRHLLDSYPLLMRFTPPRLGQYFPPVEQKLPTFQKCSLQKSPLMLHPIDISFWKEPCILGPFPQKKPSAFRC